MNLRHLFSNIICGFIPNKQLRDLTRVKIRYNTKPFVKFVRDYIGDDSAKITTCIGYGCSNFIVLVNSQFAFKFPLRDDGAERALRELRITTALRKHTQFKIPEMEIIKWNNMAVRKYEFFPGVVLSEIPPQIALANRQHIAKQVAQFMFEIGRADPTEIRDLKPKKTAKPEYLYGWFHNDVGGNFILNPETFDIVGFIDWEVAKFTSFLPSLYMADHHWDKFGYRGFVVDVMDAYSRLYFDNVK